MFRLAIVFFMAFGLAFISCKNNSSSEATETQGETMEVMTPAPAEFPSTGGGGNTSPVFQESPVQIQTQPAAQPATQPAATGSGRINPPHGQPGHRCDISVGAPLD